MRQGAGGSEHLGVFGSLDRFEAGAERPGELAELGSGARADRTESSVGDGDGLHLGFFQSIGDPGDRLILFERVDRVRDVPVAQREGALVALLHLGRKPGDDLFELTCPLGADVGAEAAAQANVLQQDVVAYRYSGGVAGVPGRFLTTQQTVRQIGSPAAAQSALNLPPGATAEQLNALVIPRGTTIYYGRVAGGGDTATQIFIQDASVLRAVP